MKNPRRFRARWALPFAFAVLTGATACSATSDAAPSRPTGAGSAPADSPAVGGTAVRVLVGGRAFAAELYDNPTARDFAGRLPVTVAVDDLNRAEKTGHLPFALTTDGVPAGADPEVDEIGYYAPGQDLVLYYGDVGYFSGIIRIGRFRDSIRGIADLPNGLTVRVERA